MSKKIISIVIILLIAIGGFYYFQGEASAQEQILQSIENMEKEDSMTMSANLAGEFTDLEKEQTINVDFTVTNDSMLPEAFRTEIDGTVGAQGMQFMGSGSMIYTDNTLYGKIEEMPQIPFMPVGDELIGQYILLQEDINWKEEMSGDMNEDLAKANKELAKAFEDADMEAKTVEDIVKETWEESWKMEVLEVTKSESEKVHGKDAQKHTININWEKFPDVVEKMMKEYKEVVPNFNEEEFEKDLQEFEKEMEKVEKATDEGTYNVYVWTDGNHILKAKTDFQGELENIKADAAMTFEFKNFGKEFDISAPEDYMSKEELNEQLPSMGPQMGPGPDLNVDTKTEGTKENIDLEEPDF